MNKRHLHAQSLQPAVSAARQSQARVRVSVRMRHVLIDDLLTQACSYYTSATAPKLSLAERKRQRELEKQLKAADTPTSEAVAAAVAAGVELPTVTAALITATSQESRFHTESIVTATKEVRNGAHAACNAPR